MGPKDKRRGANFKCGSSYFKSSLFEAMEILARLLWLPLNLYLPTLGVRYGSTPGLKTERDGIAEDLA